MPLLFNTLYRFVSIHSDFGTQETKSVISSTVPPSVCHKLMGLDAMILVFLTLCFKPAFSLFRPQEAV